MNGLELLPQTICTVPGTGVNVEMPEAGSGAGTPGPSPASRVAGGLPCDPSLREGGREKQRVCSPSQAHHCCHGRQVTFLPR